LEFGLTKFFVQIRAVDKDEGASAEVEYSIYASESPDVEYFTIHRNTGEISLLKSAIGQGLINYYMGVSKYLFHIFAENNVFQFFVRATDKGSPSLSSDLPVELLIMDPEDVAPVFERRDDKFFITEYSQPGNSSC
jgi:protocadherin Fat 1/2/3